jgi:hypothetical protein
MGPVVAVVLISAGVLLLLHHGWKHYYEEEPSHAREESCVCVCYFQIKDISHFETWSVISLTNAFLCLVDSISDERRMLLFVLFLVIGVVLLFLSCVHCSGNRPVFGCVWHNICNHETWILVCFTGAANVLWLL